MTLAEDILDWLDIVDVIGRYMALQRAWSNYKWLCPFHGEKTPSFVVSPQKQIFKCFWCGEWWDAITFVKKIDNVDFIDAAKILAKDAGVDMSKFENVVFDKKEEERKDRLKRLNSVVTKYFTQQLKNSPEAIDYLKNKRKLSPEIVKKFSIWYAPDSYYDILQFLKKQWYKDDELQQWSLAKRSHSSEQYAFFRNRIIFPIRDHMGNVIWFGWRAMKDDQQPKYVNTTDTTVYDKSHVLYGLNFVKKGIKKHDFVAVVEWYMDVIAMSRLGYDNAVATCWTSLTDGHFKLLKRYTEHVYLLFDQDKAWFEATKRALKVAYKYDVFPAVLVLPEWDFKDLDDAANAFQNIKADTDGVSVVDTMIENKIDGLSYVMDKLMTTYDLTSPVDKKRLLDEIMSILVFVTNVAIQDHYLHVVSEKLSMSKQVLEAQLKQYIRKEWRLLRREMSKMQADNEADYKPDAEMLLVSLLRSTSTLSGKTQESFESLVWFIKKISSHMTEWLLYQRSHDQLDMSQVAELEQLRLRWESELESYDSDETKLLFIFKTIRQELQRYLQYVLKYWTLTQEEKMQLLQENKDLPLLLWS